MVLALDNKTKLFSDETQVEKEYIARVQGPSDLSGLFIATYM
jgi:hypothetical protein